MEFDIQKCAMLLRKRGKISNGRHRTIKSRKNQNVCRKGKLQVLGFIGNRHHHTRGDEKIRKEYLR